MREQNQLNSKKLRLIPLMLVFVVVVCLILKNVVNYTESRVIEVTTANISLPAITVINMSHIKTEVISPEELPKGELVSPAQAVGRVLSRPVVEGQVLTESCFVPAGKAVIGDMENMRAFTLPITSTARPDDKPLYPGCFVDVQVAYKPPDRQAGGEDLFLTMLRKVPVLAISVESVVSNTEEGEEKGSPRRSSSRGAIVTLLVDTKQAEALSRAIQNGSISLSLSNH